MDDLDHLNAAMDHAMQRPDPATKAAHLALAQQNFDAMKPAKRGWFTGPQARLTPRMGGAIATSVAACFGALFLVLPQTSDTPQILPRPALLESADDFVAQSSIADPPENAEVASLSRAMDGAMPANSRNQTDSKFNVSPVTSIQSPWSSGSWLVFAAFDPQIADRVSFDSDVVVRSIDGANALLASPLTVFEVTARPFDGTPQPVGEIVLEGGGTQSIALGIPSQVTPATRFAAAVTGFWLIVNSGEDLGDWGLADAIAIAEANLGPDTDGHRAGVLAQMRMAAEQ